jgi:hypothetical protein
LHATPPPVVKKGSAEPREEGEPESTTPVAISSEDVSWYMNPSYDASDRVFGRLLDVYIFSIKYEISGLKLATMLTWQRFYYRLTDVLSNDMVRNIYERIPSSSGLTRFLIDNQAFEYKADRVEPVSWETLPSRFLTDVLTKVMRRAESKNTLIWPVYRWCDFHEHQTEEEKAVCEGKAGRQEGPDMIYKARKAREAATPKPETIRVVVPQATLVFEKEDLDDLAKYLSLARVRNEEWKQVTSLSRTMLHKCECWRRGSVCTKGANRKPDPNVAVRAG